MSYYRFSAADIELARAGKSCLLPGTLRIASLFLTIFHPKARINVVPAKKYLLSRVAVRELALSPARQPLSFLKGAKAIPLGKR